jgi:hypothetical protein
VRKTAEITIKDDGRDKGKSFLITEMPCAQAEAWACRAFGAMTHGGVEIPSTVFAMGMAGFSVLGLRAFVSAPFEETKPLLDEMFECVQRKEAKGIRALVEDDIEEVATRILLRDEVLKLHVNFSMLDTLSNGIGNLVTILSAIDPSSIRMSDGASELSSAAN